MLTKEAMAVELARLVWELDGIIREGGSQTKEGQKYLSEVNRIRTLVTELAQKQMAPRPRRTRQEMLNEATNGQTQIPETVPENSEQAPPPE